MFKMIQVNCEEFGLCVDRNEDSNIVVFCLNDYIVDEEKSEPGNTVFKKNNILEVYPTVDEVKELINVLQQILPEDKPNE